MLMLLTPSPYVHMNVSYLSMGARRRMRPPVIVFTPVSIRVTFQSRSERWMVDFSPVAMSIEKSECNV